MFKLTKRKSIFLIILLNLGQNSKLRKYTHERCICICCILWILKANCESELDLRFGSDRINTQLLTLRE